MRNVLPMAIAAALLAACSGLESKPAPINPEGGRNEGGPGLFSGKSGNILDAFRSGGGTFGGASTEIGVNIYLWRAALESVGFMPLAQADSNGGVILTDWTTNPENEKERLKVNILILGKQLRADAVQAKVFKQTKDNKGDWDDMPQDEAIARQLEDIILTKARAIKVQSLSEK